LNNNLFAGKVFISLHEVDSTNEQAKRWLSKNKPPEGAVIFTHHQTKGKGQFGKTWESEPGKNLTFSIILYPVFLEAKKAPTLNQAICLGLKDFLQSLNIPARIKWPNDIYHHDKKLAGLLIENGLTGEHLNYSVTGIGLNVNQTNFSPDIPNPTSLKLISGKEFELEKLLSEFFPFVEKRYLQLKSGRFAEIKKDFEGCLYQLNEERLYKTSTEKFEGIIRGLNEEGQLAMEIRGKTKLFSNAEIIYL